MFGGDSLRLQIILSAIDRATEPLSRISKSIGRVGRYTAAVSTVGLGLGVAFGNSLIDTASEFEKFESILMTVEGSSEKARQSMEWVSAFAAKTSFNLDETTEAFVRLRAYGMDPTNGLLQTLGDTSAGMGKSLMQSVEAIADAVTGENERLKEFGIKARASGEQIVYEYTAHGRTMTKAADKSNRQQIESVLSAIWNEKYAGAMEKMRGTWSSMVAELGDQWKRFQLLIASSGLFDAIKGKLRGLLDVVNQLAASGRLKEMAAEVGTKMLQGFTALWQGLTSVASALSTAANFLGGWQNVALAVLAIPIVAPFLSLTTAIWGLVAALVPVGFAFGPVLLAAAAIGAVAYVIIANWGTLMAFFTGLMTEIGVVFGKIGAEISRVFSDVFGGIVAGIDWVLAKIQSVASAAASMLPSFVTDAFAPNVDLAKAPKFESVGAQAQPAGVGLAKIAGVADPLGNATKFEPAATAGNQQAKSGVGQIAGVADPVANVTKFEPAATAGNQPGPAKAGLGQIAGVADPLANATKFEPASPADNQPGPAKSGVGQIAGIGDEVKLGPPASPSLATQAAGVNKTQVGGTIKIQIDSEGRPRLKELKSDNRNVDLRANTGLVMATP